jgi:hypothetical protein
VGGRGKDKGGAIEQFSGFGIRNPDGSVTLLPGLSRVIPSNQNIIPAKQAADAVAKGLKKTGKDITGKEAKELVSALVSIGALLGFKGNMRTKLYRAGRVLGDINAVRGGTKKIANRVKRRLVGKLTGKLFKKIF